MHPVTKKSHSMWINIIWIIPVLIVLLSIIVQAALVEAAPLPTGACCSIVGGCCPPAGSCAVGEQSLCDFGDYQGDGSTCPSCDTTTTTIPNGACCHLEGGCDDNLSEEGCSPGQWQGPGTICSSVECPLPTTTTIVVPTTLTQPLCGDANNDLDVTAGDALIALKTAVGADDCIPERCDFNGSGGPITSSDAQGILRYAVGQVVVPMCPVVS